MRRFPAHLEMECVAALSGSHADRSRQGLGRAVSFLSRFRIVVAVSLASLARPQRAMRHASIPVALFSAPLGSSSASRLLDDVGHYCMFPIERIILV